MQLRRTGLWACMLFLLATGCQTGPTFLRPDQQHVIDRSIVDYPPGFELREVASGLTCPSGMAFDQDGTLYIAEGATPGCEPHIFGRRPDGSILQIYPVGRRVPFINAGFKIYGPIGGIAVSNNKVFISHRDAQKRGVITAFGMGDGSHHTVVSGFPTQGDYAMTDIAVRSDGRLFFGVGSTTNSGVVGLDNWEEGWLRRYPNVCDVSPYDLKLHGAKFTSNNPIAGLFGGSDTAVTGPFQPFNVNDQIRIRHAPNGRANSAIYSISPTGGDLQLVAYGLRMPRGIGFEEGYVPYATNDGMELRGSRPIKDDPDSFLRVYDGADYGFPDYSTDCQPISDDRFQPPAHLAIRHGYPETNLLIDRAASSLPNHGEAPDRTLVDGVFPPLAGAAKFDFLPSTPAYREFHGGRRAAVALSGDRAPFATSGLPLTGPTGYKVALVSIDDKKVTDFIYNTSDKPASRIGRNVVALERPIDVKVGPDGSVYILDVGQIRLKDGREVSMGHTGRLFKLSPIVETERPASQQSR